MLFPFPVHGIVDQAPLGVVQAIDVATHLADDRLEHRQGIDEIILVLGDHRDVDHREGIEAEAVAQAKLDEIAAEHLAHVFERTSVVDDDDASADAGEGRAQLLQRDRLARARLAEHRDVVVARLVLERRPEERLTAAADEHQMRHVAAQELALQRSDVRRRRGKHRAKALHPLQVIIQIVGKGHGQNAHE